MQAKGRIKGPSAKKKRRGIWLLLLRCRLEHVSTILLSRRRPGLSQEYKRSAVHAREYDAARLEKLQERSSVNFARWMHA